ncbi:Hypothetical protein SRAE_1000321600 [Strongyloides ratti]|uniref:PMP-22/EMP/MP20/Claudin superfamily-containing protein n=1 Tax=Strongyloides ratti TaxID=34506 RepID=A0A090L9Z6_STRRB|nr:Hypothetical protein SRAE_1000321600 [Strongyloides ratti]CEF64963.1 Hypothetical protein SRAE_1000321600 [Strongyloides ratti]
MGSRITSLIAVILTIIFLIISGVLFFLGFINFKPESLKDISKIKEVKTDLSKLPIIDVEEYLKKNRENQASISFINDTEITKGSLYTYPKCFYIEKSIKELTEYKDLSSFKPSLELGQSVKFNILPGPNAKSTIDFCGKHNTLFIIQAVVVGTGSISAVLQVIISVLTILIIFGCCKYSNMPLVVAVIGLFGFICAAACLGGFVYFTKSYYTLRGLESKEVAETYGLPEQGNNIYYLLACGGVLVSNLVFVIMMFVACGQRKKEIIVDATTTLKGK